MRLSRLVLAAVPAAFLWGCGAPCNPAALDPGTAAGEIDGTDWEAGSVAWTAAGDAVQITTAADSGWRLTVAAQTSLDDQPTDLFPGDGTLVIAYPDGGGSYAANEPDQGTITVWEGEPDEVWACVDVTAVSGDDESVDLVGVALRAVGL